MSKSGAKDSNNLSTTEHVIATNRNLRPLLAWGAQLAASKSKDGKRVMWVPCHALNGTISPRTWVLERAKQMLGADASADALTLLTGVADTLLIVDPSHVDAFSLRWFCDIEVAARNSVGVGPGTPLPGLAVLVRSGEAEGPIKASLEKLQSIDVQESRVSGRDADLSSSDIETEVRALQGRHEPLLGILALLPAPVKIQDFELLAAAAGSNKTALREVTAGGLFQVVDGYVVAAQRSVQPQVRKVLAEGALRDSASRCLAVMEQIFEGLPEALVEVIALAGDSRRATRIANERLEQLHKAEQFEDALRLCLACERLELGLDTGRFGSEVDRARIAAMYAETGDYEAAKPLVEELVQRRDVYRTRMFIEWLALAARKLAVEIKWDPRTADSLVRRAIRLAGDDLDRVIILMVLRVRLLNSVAMQLDDRAGWLLTHINNKMLAQVGPFAAGMFLEEAAAYRVQTSDYKGAFKRLRRLAALELSDQRRADAFLKMAICRKHFNDHEAALRYANSAVQFGVRGAEPEIVKQAVQLVREIEKAAPKVNPKLAPAEGRGGKPRLPSTADFPTLRSPEAPKVFEILQNRFGALGWVRRRGPQHETLGDVSIGNPAQLSVYQELSDGNVSATARNSDVGASVRGIVLLRRDGSDFVVFSPRGDQEPRDEALARFLLTDRGGDAFAGTTSPARSAVMSEYFRRAHASSEKRNLNRRLARAFTTDMLNYLDEQGLTKDEMADRLGVSRATLYRMFARAGLNR